MKVFIGHNLTCSLNYQPDYIKYNLENNCEITDNPKEADKIIFTGTCCCTEYNMLNTISYIISVLKEKKKDAKVYLTGCLAREMKNYSELEIVKKFLSQSIDYIIPQEQPNLLLQMISEDLFKEKKANRFGACNIVEEKKEASLYISTGCQNNCSFCKTTFQKLPLVSENLDDIKEQLDCLNNINVNHINLIGTNICQYGLDIYHEPKLPEIIEYIENKTNIKDIHLIGFAYKDAIKYHFQEVLKNSFKTNYIDGSLESGSGRLLKLMQKGFTSQEIIDFITSIKEKHYKELCINIIAGFPTETIYDIKKTLEVLKNIDPEKVHICRYINSSFVDSNQYQQLTPEEIQNHARIYEKVLTRRKVQVNMLGSAYFLNK